MDARDDELTLMVRKYLEVDGYAVVTDAALGIDAEDRMAISRKYFEDTALEADLVTVHADRRRSRDVLRYVREDARIELSENPTVTIVNRSGHEGARTPLRVETLNEPTLQLFVRRMLDFVPQDRRSRSGTFGINFFQTRTNVVSKPHRDDEDFCIIYVVDIRGSDAETQLRKIDDPDEIHFRYALRAGEILIFDDTRFLHYTSPISGPDSRYRNALVCTVDSPTTYPSDDRG
jgi:hypothetical protein